MKRRLLLLALLTASPLAAQHQDHVPREQQADHSDHAGHDMGDTDKPSSPGPTMETSPPRAAGSGPPRAADAIWGAEAMRASHKDLRRTHGDFPVFWFQGDRLETQVRQGAEAYLWDIQGYYGKPTERLWFKSEGEGEFGAALEDAEVQALYAKAIAPFWDLQAGVRHDLAGPDTTHAVIGDQGLAPYLFEVDAALFLSHQGDLTARIEAEIDQRITRRLILQPRIEANLAAQNTPDPATAAASIVMTAMPGVENHGEMMIRNFTASWSDDGQTMTLTLRQPFRAGTYEVRWQAAAGDGHPMSGVVGFNVN